MRTRITVGARDAIVRAGYRGATVDQIAAAAGVSVGLLYRYFGSKEDLFLSVCTGVTDRSLEALASALRDVPDSDERLRVAIDAFVDSLEDAGWGKLIANAWLEAETSPRLRALVDRRFDQLRAFAEEFVRDAISRGEVRPDADVVGLSLGAATVLEGLVARRVAGGPGFNRARESAAARELLSAALAGNAPIRDPHDSFPGSPRRAGA